MHSKCHYPQSMHLFLTTDLVAVSQWSLSKKTVGCFSKYLRALGSNRNFPLRVSLSTPVAPLSNPAIRGEALTSGEPEEEQGREVKGIPPRLQERAGGERQSDSYFGPPSRQRVLHLGCCPNSARRRRGCHLRGIKTGNKGVKNVPWKLWTGGRAWPRGGGSPWGRPVGGGGRGGPASCCSAASVPPSSSRPSCSPAWPVKAASSCPSGPVQYVTGQFGCGGLFFTGLEAVVGCKR